LMDMLHGNVCSEVLHDAYCSEAVTLVGPEKASV